MPVSGHVMCTIPVRNMPSVSTPIMGLTVAAPKVSKAMDTLDASQVSLSLLIMFHKEIVYSTILTDNFLVMDYKPVCQYNEDCPPNKLCDRLNRKCINPCFEDSCGENADCIPENHGAKCLCRAGYLGNAYVHCIRGNIINQLLNRGEKYSVINFSERM